MKKQTKTEARRICNDILKLHKKIQDINKRKEVLNEKKKL